MVFWPFINNLIKNIFNTPTSRAKFKSFCEAKITIYLVAFFMQTIKEKFCNILKCSFRFFIEYLVCTIRHDYFSSVVTFLYFDLGCLYLSISSYSWFHGSVISLKTWHKQAQNNPILAGQSIIHGYGPFCDVKVCVIII